MSEVLWQRSDGCVGSQIEDALVLLDLESGQYLALNGTATDIWEAIAEPTAESSIVEVLTRKYRIEPEPCSKSVRRLLAYLTDKGLAKTVG